MHYPPYFCALSNYCMISNSWKALLKMKQSSKDMSSLLGSPRCKSGNDKIRYLFILAIDLGVLHSDVTLNSPEYILSHRNFLGQAIKQFTRTRCLHFCKEIQVLRHVIQCGISWSQWKWHAPPRNWTRVPTLYQLS